MSEKNNYFKAIRKISSAFGTTYVTDDLLKLIVESAVETMNAKAASLFLEDRKKRDQFKVVSQTGLSDNYHHAGFGHVKKVQPQLLKKGFIHFRDASNDPSLDNIEAKKAEGIGSILTVPIMVKNRLIGFLALYTSNIRDFSPDEIEFLTLLAEQGGMAIERARLLNKVWRNIKIFIDLAANINSSLDLKTILQTLTEDVAKSIGVKAASIRLLDDSRKNLNLVASYGLSEKYISKGPIAAEKSIAEVINTGKPIVIPNVQNDPGTQYKNEKMNEGIVSILSVPIKSKEEVIGILRLYSDEEQEFQEDEIMLVTALAYQGGMAIQNAGLYLMLKEDVKDMKENIWSHKCWF